MKKEKKNQKEMENNEVEQKVEAKLMERNIEFMVENSQYNRKPSTSQEKSAGSTQQNNDVIKENILSKITWVEKE